MEKLEQKPIIELRSITKRYGEKTIIDGLDLTINDGEFLTILGPSGCGKTTVLRLIAGFEELTDGAIILDGQDVSDIPAEQRPVNTVFQSYALFPHMTIFENVAFGLRMQKVPNDQIKPRVMEALRMVRLEEMANRKPSQLSGGQQQRIAIARAVVNQPKVLLLDESLSALDYKLRKEMQHELKQLQRQLGITFIFVTHDQEEALTMSDRIIVMNKGKVQQDGSPKEIYEDPTNLFVARFIGEINVFDATVIERIDEKRVKANVEGRICEIYTKLDVQPSQKVKVLLRPEDIVIEELDENESSKAIIGHVSDRTYKGMTLESNIVLDHNQMKVLVSEFFNEDDPHIDHSVGQKVALTWHEGWEVVLNDENE
ncbi:Spermidine/putrescine import ATP-binding protein PotA [Bibersteinia trehalosi USDA-ARS-USMARC-188]|uniref:Spermidine/putrescine import ATP-binding protein PotA n=5 Tax=Bibersteinia trehalosi TaxID=47735 RepID=W0R4A3_BIBTR|nr:spermidine/putrescine ABC transporter ATP-binding protein PotA [Bibersteinia trehalosi]AGH38002.1 Spermidine/putrescine import ATP-binding protein PotA [Bibersteinia trehalosi USDA-ARS-USMARC-192]AHG82198.1 Spermidine/putrescine import ATP-binding protein PotA [Bibersteinia trehalosi USDA-ARS-USMARC-188]AHG84511.1 Spermidine/putrescine import ATP-binding protein PotA [Bibersteinia trehalosi USDA-ARS-USMARC-189]AHG85989.1 Spermidine/putrescine import ATP-binding protein PotA [Bibersteinia tre